MLSPMAILFSRNCHTVSRSSCTVFHSHQHCPVVPLALYLLLFSVGFSFFENTYSGGCGVIPHYGFASYFPND